MSVDDFEEFVDELEDNKVISKKKAREIFKEFINIRTKIAFEE
jgi:hypothetical protein